MRIDFIRQHDRLTADVTARTRILLSIEELMTLDRERRQQNVLCNALQPVVLLDRVLHSDRQYVGCWPGLS